MICQMDFLPLLQTAHMIQQERGDYQADLAKSAGIGVYTIAVDQTDEGVEYMSHLSSSTH